MKAPALESLSNKVAGLYEYCTISKNIYFEGHLPKVIVKKHISL